jgi:hypothetical protein
VADLTDVDIGEAQESQRLALEADAQVAPIHAVLDFWRALRWLVPGWPVAKPAKLAKLLPKDPANREAEVQAAAPGIRRLLKLLEPGQNLVAVLGAGRLDGDDAATLAANA